LSRRKPGFESPWRYLLSPRRAHCVLEGSGRTANGRSAAWHTAQDVLVQRQSCGFAALDPLTEDRDALGGPGSVAWHRAGLEPVEDGVGVGRDVVERPEIEGEAHRIAVALAEQRLDVLLE